MNEALCYRGRRISDEDIASIRQIIAQNPGASRRKLSTLVCRAWEWRQANGAWRDMVCRGLMLALHRAGHIELPAQKFSPPNPLAQRARPACEPVAEKNPLDGPLSALMPLCIHQVRRTEQEGLFNGLLDQHHYLGYTQPVGEHLKYLVCAGDRPVACLAWSSAPWHMGPRDRFIGWTPTVRRRNLHLLAYNTRFLILPWVQVRHLASHILGQMARRLSADWEALYGHPIYYLETFVDRDRFAGTCYRAANWRCLGQTTGRGIKDKVHQVTLSIKDVLGYPLRRDFRRRLCEVPA
ncbi:MAG: DUF4338 domain-containing protein [Sedimentisphaerales bacterium]|nr:DUF4338 domain-containing protein [Sedimentisphaerales bacterium]